MALVQPDKTSGEVIGERFTILQAPGVGFGVAAIGFQAAVETVEFAGAGTLAVPQACPR
jgi:hypothetical protein